MNPLSKKNKLLIGDYMVIIMGILLVAFLFQKLWSFSPANQLTITQADKVIGTYDLNQTKDLHIHGPRGVSLVSIEGGKARFKRSPCNNQYCVHQGWLSKSGQAAICLPNQVSIELTGAKKTYDSLNY